jgi:hypothetical protein
MKPDFVVIEEALKTKTISLDFMLAWGSLNSLLGRQLELLASEDDISKPFVAGVLSGGAQTVKLQRCWYARWVRQHDDAERLIKREQIQREIADLCLDIWRERRSPPANFASEWFEALICQENNDDVPQKGPVGNVDLRRSYQKIGWELLGALAEDTTVSDAMIPPLSLAAFPQTIHRHP